MNPQLVIDATKVSSIRILINVGEEPKPPNATMPTTIVMINPLMVSNACQSKYFASFCLSKTSCKSSFITKLYQTRQPYLQLTNPRLGRRRDSVVCRTFQRYNRFVLDMSTDCSILELSGSQANTVSPIT